MFVRHYSREICEHQRDKRIHVSRNCILSVAIGGRELGEAADE